MIDSSADGWTPLAPDERRELLRLARSAIGAEFALSEAPALRLERPVLMRPSGAFVTLHTCAELRGCVGTIEPRKPLYSVVITMARSAAFEDPRFAPLTREDWPHLHVEISRLGPLHLATPESVEPGRHGVYVVRGPARGLLLPQVATRESWDSTRLLQATCRKAGLPTDSWKMQGTEIYVFEAEVFEDPT